MDGVCRTCLGRNESLFPLFDESKSIFDPGSAIVDFVNIFTEFMISRIDGFPERICTSCISEVKQAYAFKLKCENSEASLHQLQEIHGTLNLADICNIPKFESANQLAKLTFDQTCPLNDIEMNDDADVVTTRSIMDFLKVEPEEYDCQENNYLSNEDPEENIPYRNDESESNNYEEIGSAKSANDFKICSKDEKSKDLSSDEEDRKLFNALSCSACPAVFRDRSLLRSHIVDYHTDGKLCILCNKVYECSMWAHTESHLPSQFQCSECSLGFERRYLLQVHLKSHKVKNEQTGKFEFQCDTCPRTFASYAEFLGHKKIHTGEKPFRCKICSMAFRLKDNLRCHMVTHSEERPFKCKLCTSSFKRKDKLRSHINFVHDESGEYTFKCEFCSRRFRCKNKLQNHMSSHGIEVDKMYECHICKKTFNLKETLKCHMVSHSDSRPFSCTSCSAMFKRKCNLASHMQFMHVKIESKEKPPVSFKCELCSKTFTRKDKLKLHMTSHSDERPFECKFCESKFKRKDGLVRHMKSQHNSSKL